MLDRLLLAACLASVAIACPAVEPRDPRQTMDAAIRLLFDAEPVDAAKLFDAVVAARPEAEPHLWQRGIALYYADRFADGRLQFEQHRTVNPDDVENVAWHFACVARKDGPEAAREALLPVGEDSRVPLKEVLRLFGTKLEPAQGLAKARAAVVEAADGGEEAARRNQRCYAHLYLGLHAEAIGDAAAARDHMRQAAGPFSMDHFMGRIAQVHCRLRGW